MQSWNPAKNATMSPIESWPWTAMIAMTANDPKTAAVIRPWVRTTQEARDFETARVAVRSDSRSPSYRPRKSGPRPNCRTSGAWSAPVIISW